MENLPMPNLRKVKTQKGRDVKNYLTPGSKSTVLRDIKKTANKARRYENKVVIENEIYDLVEETPTMYWYMMNGEEFGSLKYD